MPAAQVSGDSEIAQFADFEDAFGVDFRVAAEAYDFFVAGAFAFFDEARADPPG